MMENNMKIAELYRENEFNNSYKPLKLKDLTDKNIVTVFDLLNADDNIFKTYKQQAFIKLKTEFERFEDEIATVIIPSGYTDSLFLENWIKFLNEFHEAIVLPDDKQLFEFYIGLQGEDLRSSDNYIDLIAGTGIFKYVAETIRLKFKSFEESIARFISNPQKGYGINTEFLLKFNEIEREFTNRYCFPMVDIVSIISVKEIKEYSHNEMQSFNCLLDVLNYKKIKGNDITNILKNNNIIIPEKLTARTFEDTSRTIKQTVSNNIFPISKTKIIEILNQESQLDVDDRIINSILFNFGLFVQNDRNEFYLKEPSSVTMLYIALTKLDGIDTYENIEAKIKELFQNIDHIDSYRNVLNRYNDVFFNIGKASIFGINKQFPKIIEKIGNGTIPDIVSNILRNEDIPVFGRTLFVKYKSIFPEKIQEYIDNEKSFISGIEAIDCKERFVKFPGPYFGISDKNYPNFESKSFTGVIFTSMVKYIIKNPNSTYNKIIEVFSKENSLYEEQIRKVIDDKIQEKKIINDNQKLSINKEFVGKMINNDFINDLEKISDPDFNDEINFHFITNKIQEIEVENVVVEGGTKLIEHFTRERNRKIIRTIKKNRSWVCDICKHEMNDTYGFNFIDAHHKMPLMVTGETQTTESDIALLCPNCHRAIHNLMFCYENKNYDELKSYLEQKIEFTN
jgi:predicted HNH restriction endonuclease